ncbi:MAG: hypothetical protein AAF125_08035 [Chloroflexota bacterium]
MTDNMEPNEDTIAETELYEAWVSYEDDNEPIYHLDTGRATLHFFQEEWDELLGLFEQLIGDE